MSLDLISPSVQVLGFNKLCFAKVVAKLSSAQLAPRFIKPCLVWVLVELGCASLVPGFFRYVWFASRPSQAMLCWPSGFTKLCLVGPWLGECMQL